MELITIAKSDYDDLVRSQEKLIALENGGVDNWDWYYDSLKDWYRKYYPEYLDEDEG